MECRQRFIIWTCIVLLTGGQPGYLAAKRIEHVCGTKNIRNVVEAFKDLENCTVIEGNLSILLIENAQPESYDNLHFPKLLEITDYLLLYRVYKLKTLAAIFPNLAVIKGQNLFYNYAVVAFEVPDLEELGLPSLVKVVRGAIRLEKNPQLCYIDTIDWSRITNQDMDEHFFIENKRVDECVNVCPKAKNGANLCPKMTLPSGEKQPLCWDGDDCQKVCENPSCGDRGCYTAIDERGRKETACCHEECLGGCTGPKATHCIVCKHIFSNGRCLSRCHLGTFTYRERRCVTAEACRGIDQKHARGKDRHDWKVDTVNRKCIPQCPTNYTESIEDPHKCIRCAGTCPKVCEGLVIDSVAAAQKLKGCSVINGILEIQIIRGGRNVGHELEENLGMLEEVTLYVKIMRSYAIRSLSFLKSLKVIRGEKLLNNRYALYVDDNQNLQGIWDFNIHPKLTVYNGTMKFSNNRRLCLTDIDQLANSTTFGNKKFRHVDPKDITSNNGDNAACNDTELELNLTINAEFAYVRWKNFQTADSRALLSWSVNYREAPEKNLTKFNSRDACNDEVWKTEDVKPPSDPRVFMAHVLVDLKPFTQYAVYVQTFTISVGIRGAASEIHYFTTDPKAPTYPQDLKVEVPRVGDMLVKWKPPNKPGGLVTHYYVYYQPQPLKAERFDRRDYCTDTLRLPRTKKTQEVPQDKSNATIDGLCCACPKSKADLKSEEDERMFQIHFENFLHNKVYQKRPESIDKSKSTPTQLRRKRRSRAEYRSLAGDKPNRMSKNETSPAVNVSKVESDETYMVQVVNVTEILLTNLSHFEEYSIEVIACHNQSKVDTKRKMCSNRAITTARTLPLDSADNIDARNVTTYNDSTVSGRVWVKWAPPVSPNGLIVAYDIALKKVEVADIKEDIYCLTHKKHREEDGYLTNSLSPGNWSYRIRATSLAGNGSWTKEMYFYVIDYDTPEGVKAELIAGVTVSIAFVLLLVIGGVIWAVAKNRFNAGRGLLIASFNPDYWSAGNIYVPDEWEVPREKIKLVRELGQGSFGMVYEGLATDLNEEHMGKYNVAVKTVNETASLRERIEFLNEASVMKAFKCNHVVRLMGVVSKGQPTLVVMELMVNGDLKSFLRLFRPDNEENVNSQPPTLKEILEMAGEIADGMAYLAAKKFVHRDLAARNCMVSENMVVKIGDFGMTRDIYETDYYKKGGKGLLPVRWMAPESLKDGIFTSQSDVWSYGVVLWEMATLAAQPYQGFANEQVLKYVIDGGIMELPENCPEKLYNLMLMCWKLNPKQRPTFCQIIEILVPDLNIDFEKVSYFFSEENQLNMHSGSNKCDDASSVLDYDDARTPLTASPSLHRSVGQLQDLEDMGDASRHSSLSYETNRPQLSADPDMTRCDHRDQCDCVEIAGHEPWVKQTPATAMRRDSGRSSQGSNPGNGGIVSNEGSAGSTKSSSSSHGLNGIPNGRIPMYIVPPRS